MWSKVDHRIVFVMFVQPAPNQFTVHFIKVAAGGVLNPPPTDGLRFYGIVTLFLWKSVYFNRVRLLLYYYHHC